MAGLASRYSRPLFFITVAILFAVCLPHPSSEANRVAVNWTPLIERLIKDGEDGAKMRRLFARSEVRFDPRVMPRKLTHSEAKLDYAQFLRPDRIARAERFIYANYQLLTRIEQEYGVPKEVCVAILLVETDLGRNPGGALVFNVLASMALASDLKQVRPWLPDTLFSSSENDMLMASIQKKSEWAYHELHAFLDYAYQNNIDPLSIRGSIFGAIGICQFMPTNAILFGVDEDKDGRIDLLSKADAIASMANYLKSYGWSPGLNYDDAVQVILKYNYSRPYAETVLQVAERLGLKIGDNSVVAGVPDAASRAF
ncbi:MAG: lytic murein transglycosylase [Dissulfurimicrobium sp.]|uniref:lytic murein transglycosylase n=1 Tax=Dissulfurimicrobium TaxID=1769732 RepID=UPI003C72CE2D